MPAHRVENDRTWQPGITERLEDFVDRRYRPETRGLHDRSYRTIVWLANRSLPRALAGVSEGWRRGWESNPPPDTKCRGDDFEDRDDHQARITLHLRSYCASRGTGLAGF